MVEVLTFLVQVRGEFVAIETGKNDRVSTVIKQLNVMRYLGNLTPYDYKIYCLDTPILVSKWDGSKGPEVKPRALLRSVIRGPFHPESVALIVQTHEEGTFGRYFYSALTC